MMLKTRNRFEARLMTPNDLIEVSKQKNKIGALK